MPIVVRSVSSPSSWRTCDPSSPCPYFRVSYDDWQLVRHQQTAVDFLFLCVFAEITHRFQSAREDVRALLLQCLLPWLQNMELVATSVPPATPLSYIMVGVPVKSLVCCALSIAMLHLQYFPDSGTRGRREGTGSTEATEMILNNLFYITAKVSRLNIYINALLNCLSLSLSLCLLS